MLRGFFSLLTRERDSTDYNTGIFLASSDPDITTLAVAKVREHLPHLSFTFVAPRAYGKMFPQESELITFDAVKGHGYQSVAQLRARRFDVSVVLLPGRPSFAKAKLAAFVLNTRRIFVFNEYNELIPLDASHRAYLPLLLVLRFWRRTKKILFPFGFAYLVYRTLKLKLRARRNGLKPAITNAADLRLP